MQKEITCFKASPQQQYLSLPCFLSSSSLARSWTALSASTESRSLSTSPTLRCAALAAVLRRNCSTSCLRSWQSLNSCSACHTTWLWTRCPSYTFHRSYCSCWMTNKKSNNIVHLLVSAALEELSHAVWWPQSELRNICGTQTFRISATRCVQTKAGSHLQLDSTGISSHSHCIHANLNVACSA